MSSVWVLGGVEPFQPMLGAITISRAGDCALALLVMGTNRVCFTLPQMATLPRPLSRNIWQLSCARAQHIREKPGLNYRGRHRLWLFVFLMCRFQGDLNAVWPGPGGGYLSIIRQGKQPDDCARGSKDPGATPDMCFDRLPCPQLCEGGWVAVVAVRHGGRVAPPI